MASDPAARYAELVVEGTGEMRRGEFRRAADLFEQSRLLAVELDDQVLLSRALCNLSAVKLSLGEVREAEKGLREILLRSSEPNIIFLASSNLASALRRQGQLSKALLYAKRALKACDTLDNTTWKAQSHNLLANIYLNMSYLDDAIAEYRVALSLGGGADGNTAFPNDYIRENLGYCTLLKKRYREGIRLIDEALGMARANGNIRCIAESHQDLSFAYMQVKDLVQAEEHGEKALQIATEKEYTDILRNCYYLLGEINLLLNRDARSDHYFNKLQELYPHLGVLKQFLRTFDVSGMINFKNPF